MAPVTIKVIDDSGLIGVVDPAAYESFVDENWTYEMMLAHFHRQMAERRLLIWGTGMEFEWQVDIGTGRKRAGGFREVTGTIRATGKRLCMISYDDLTMAAQYRDVSIPEPHDVDQLFEVRPGLYECRIVQLFDPEDLEADLDALELHFIVELEPARQPTPAWETIPWHD